MLGNKKQTFDEKINAAKYECVLSALKDILSLKIEASTKDGATEIDYAATCSAIKTKARLALDFITVIDNDSESKNKNEVKGNEKRTSKT